jgi:hypothetical protein
MVASNFFLSEVLDLPHAKKHRELTEAWLKGETIIPEIADLYPTGPIASLEILSPAQAISGEPLEFQIVVKNRKVGHNLITGPLDFLRVWLHVRIEDADGKLLGEWGGIDPTSRDIFDEPGVIHESGRPRDSGTLVLEGVPLDESGNDILRHELWRKAGGKGQRTIFPHYADKQRYRVAIPAGVTGPLQVKAELNFRRYRQQFLDLVVPAMERDSGVYQPTITLTTASHAIPIAPVTAAVESAATPPFNADVP